MLVLAMVRLEDWRGAATEVAIGNSCLQHPSAKRIDVQDWDGGEASKRPSSTHVNIVAIWWVAKAEMDQAPSALSRFDHTDFLVYFIMT